MWATGCILFELITRKPLFAGKHEGLQIFEQAQILGFPGNGEVAYLNLICEVDVVEVFNKLFIPLDPVEIGQLLIVDDKQAYGKKEITLAADLIKSCLMWVPKERIQARSAA